MATAHLPPVGLLGRQTECRMLDQLVTDVRGGQSRVLVLRGDAGVGKTALLGYLAGQASGDFRLARAAGVESEMELAFAGLHALCAPLLHGLEHLPRPQHDALSTAFGLSAGPRPDRFLVGLAVLTLLAAAAEQQPLVCIVDDAQWLDRVSAQTLGFVARRLLAERVLLVFAVRDTGGEDALEGLPDHVLGGLGARDAQVLLNAAVPGPLDERVRHRLLAEADGNPLALIELPRGRTPTTVAGGFVLPDAMPLTTRLERGFVQQVEALPGDTRLLLVLAASESVGDLALLWRAAATLGLGQHALDPARAAGLVVETSSRVRFRHPLVRSAAYRSATPLERREVHRALAEATEPKLDPERRAWHLAHAADGPDEAVAGELERSAGRAHARGGLAAAAAFLERATELTPEAGRRGARALAAARAMLEAGAMDAAQLLLTQAQMAPLDEVSQARTQLLSAQIAFASSRSRDVAPLLLAAARRLGPLDPQLARETYLEAFSAAMFAGRLAGKVGVDEVALAAREAPASTDGRPISDLLLEGLTELFTEGYRTAVPTGRRVLEAFGRDDLSVQDGLRWLWLASAGAADLWDDASWCALATRHVTMARASGALAELPLALNSRAQAHVFSGEFDAADALLGELQLVREATGTNLAPYGALGLAAWRGRELEANNLIETTRADVLARGEGIGVTIAQWAKALLANALGHYDEARVAAVHAAEDPRELAAPNWALSELVEAAARSSMPDVAADALERLSQMTGATGSDWALGIECRCRALLSEGEEADRQHREAIARLGRSRIRGEAARAHLLYGEWLRGAGRRTEAREQLHTAHAMLTHIGAEAFAERARRELLASGGTVQRHTQPARVVLTRQEVQIARLAADGHTNPEIGAQLFISPRTVEYHLRKVFGKLGVGSRRELARALPVGAPVTTPV